MWIKYLTFIAKRIFVLYFLIAGSIYMISDHTTIKEGILIRKINHLIPESYDLFFTAHTNLSISKDEIYKHKLYYENIILLHPEMTETFSLLGYCAFLEHNVKKAESYFEKAVDSDPKMFWHTYNLGILQFKSHQYEKALKTMHKAFKLNPASTLNSISSSRMIYHPILAKSKNLIELPLPERLRHGYTKAAMVIITTMYRNSEPPVVQQTALTMAKQIPERKDFFLYYAGLASHELGNNKKALLYLQESIKTNSEFAEPFILLAKILQTLDPNHNIINILKQGRQLEAANKTFDALITNIRPQIF